MWWIFHIFVINRLSRRSSNDKEDCWNHNLKSWNLKQRKMMWKIVSSGEMIYNKVTNYEQCSNNWMWWNWGRQDRQNSVEYFLKSGSVKTFPKQTPANQTYILKRPHLDKNCIKLTFLTKCSQTNIGWYELKWTDGPKVWSWCACGVQKAASGWQCKDMNWYWRRNHYWTIPNWWHS